MENIDIPITDNQRKKAKTRLNQQNIPLDVSLGAIAVRSLLQYLGFSTYFDSFTPTNAFLNNKKESDLEKWKLKCIPVPPNVNECSLEGEEDNVIASVIVKIDLQNEQKPKATVLGYVPGNQTNIELDKLTPLNDLVDLIYQAEYPISANSDRDRQYKQAVRNIKQQSRDFAKSILALIFGLQNSGKLSNIKQTNNLHKLLLQLNILIVSWQPQKESFITWFNNELNQMNKEILPGQEIPPEIIYTQEILLFAPISELNQVPSSKYPWFTYRHLFYLLGKLNSVERVTNKLHVNHEQTVYRWLKNQTYKSICKQISDLLTDWEENRFLYIEEEEFDDKLRELEKEINQCQINFLMISFTVMKSEFDQQLSPTTKITYRHLFYLKGKGYSLKEITDMLGITENIKTLKELSKNISDKLRQNLLNWDINRQGNIQLSKQEFSDKIQQLKREIQEIQRE